MTTYENDYKKSLVTRISNGESINTVCNDDDAPKIPTVKKWLAQFTADPTCFDVKPFTSLKEELQGNGILKTIRSDFIGHTVEMAELALNAYESKIGTTLTKQTILNNTDEVLKCLIQEETQIFNERMNQMEESVLPTFYREHYNKGTPYVHLDAVMASMDNIYSQVQSGIVSREEFVASISKSIIPVARYIATSNSQSAKTRAGASLENHLSLLLTRCGFSFDTQVRTKNGETRADFFLPNLASAYDSPTMVINIECQTTLKDRHRMTSGKLTDLPLQRYLATGTGCGLFNEHDINDFSFEKLQELLITNHIIVVVFEDVKNILLGKIDQAIEDMKNDPSKSPKLSLDEMESLKSRAMQNLISYKELFNNTIVPYTGLWKSKNLI